MSDLNQELDLSVLDQDLNEIPELAGFEVPPNGLYRMNLSVEFKEVSDRPTVEFSYEVLETIELNNKAETPSQNGTKFSTLFFLGGFKEDAHKARMLSDLKKLTTPLAEHLGESNLLKLLKEAIPDAAPIEVIATVRRRADKEDKERFYATVKDMQIV